MKKIEELSKILIDYSLSAIADYLGYPLQGKDSHRSDTYSIFKESRRELPDMEEWYSSFVHIPCGWWVDEEVRPRLLKP